MTGSASTTRTIAEAHARLKGHGEIQFDLPDVKPPEPPPSWLIDFMRFFESLGPGSRFVFWGLVIAGAALILFLVGRGLVRRLRVSRSVAAAAEPAAAWRPEEKVARTLLAEADAMAEAGRYDEAAHLLLHRSLEDIARRRPRLLRPALTSREIARVPALPEAVRGAFAAMAAPVERSLFGGRALARSDWEEARAAYSAFALPEAWT